MTLVVKTYVWREILLSTGMRIWLFILLFNFIGLFFAICESQVACLREQMTHSMAATHVQEQADTIIGQNSGGADDNLFIAVSRQQYVEAWLVDPCIVDTAVSTQDSKQLRIQPPAKSLEWDMLVNKIWNKPRWRIIGSICALFVVLSLVAVPLAKPLGAKCRAMYSKEKSHLYNARVLKMYAKTNLFK